MITVLKDILSPEESASIIESVKDVDGWTDGKRTAGEVIRERKVNEQLFEVPEEPRKLMLEKLMGDATFQTVTYPTEMSNPMVSRYTATGAEETGHYDWHVDAALRGQSKRRDVSVSILLSDPDSYEGGEMVFAMSAVRAPVKPPAGTAVLFPSFLEHKISPVTKGVRYVAISWVTSVVNGFVEREILWRLFQAQQMAKGEQIDHLAYARENLLRLWANGR